MRKNNITTITVDATKGAVSLADIDAAIKAADSNTVAEAPIGSDNSYENGASGPDLMGHTVEILTRRCDETMMPLRSVQGRAFCLVHGWA